MVSAASWLAFRQRSSRTPSRQRTRRVPCASTRQRPACSTAALTAASTVSSAAPCTRAVRSAAQLRANSTCKSGSRYSRMVLRRKCSTANGWKPRSVPLHPASHRSGVRRVHTPVTARRGSCRVMGTAIPARTAVFRAVSTAVKLQALAHAANTRHAHRAQKIHPANRLCQNTKGAQNTPGTAAQTHSTARPLGGMISAVRSRSRSVIFRKGPRHPSSGAGCHPGSGRGCGPRAAGWYCRGG